MSDGQGRFGLMRWLVGTMRLGGVRGADFRAVVDAAAAGVVVTRAGRVSFANDSMARILGVPPGSMVGAQSSSFGADFGGTPGETRECSLRRADGASVRAYVASSSAPPVGEVHVVVELPARRPSSPPGPPRARRRLPTDDSLAMAAHEIRAPLASIQVEVAAMIQAALDAPGDPYLRDGIVGRADSVARQVERLGVIVSNLLDTSAIHAGKVELVVAPVDVSELVRSVVSGLAAEASHAGSDLTVSAPRPVVGLWDRFRIEQVVINLISNAIKYGNGGPIAVEASASGGAAVIRVRDSGIGIAPEHRERIFEQFVRVKTPGRSERGLGLGLWIARSLVELHGGSIRLTSELGKGSEFVVELPLG